MTKTDLKKITLDELYAEFEEIPLVQRRRKKDDALMFDRYGEPIMVQGTGPKEIPPETKASIDKLLEREDVEGMVLYINIQMDSSSFGRKQAMVFGPGCTFKNLEACPPHLNDLPSQRQYPQAIYLKE